MTATNYRAPLAMVTTLFFMWGFLTCLNDILIPHLKAIFDLNYAQVMLVQFAFFSAYAIFSIPSGKIVERIGYHRMMVGGLLMMAVGALLFIPAASVPSFPLFLTALIILAAGITALQVAANPYVALLGPAKTSSARLTMTQAFNSLGTFIAPWFGGVLILATGAKTAAVIAQMNAGELHAYRVEQASSIKLPYLMIAAALMVLAVVIGRFKMPHIPEAEGGHAAESGEHDKVLHHRNLVMGALAIFCYVGAEVSIGSFLVNYMHEPNIGNLDLETAAKFLTVYWGGAMVGRFIGSAVLQPRSAKSSTGIQCGRGRTAGLHLDGDQRLFRHGQHVADRPVQLHHVSHHLYPGHRRPGRADRRRIGAAEHRDRRRSNPSLDPGIHRRPAGHPSRFHTAGPVLPVHLAVCD